MALFSSFNLCILFYAFIFICNASSWPSKYVPVLMWESTVNTSDLSPAVNRIPKDDFKDIIIDRQQNLKTSFLIFQEETLSPEDLKSEIYPRTSNLKNKAPLNYYTSVEESVEVLHKLGNNVKEISVSELKNLKIDPGQIVIVRLNDANDGEYREDMLARHDAIIYSTSKDVLSNNKNVIIMYTGKKASFQEPNEKYTRQRRDTKADEPGQSDNSIMTYNKILAIYASKNSYMVQEKIDLRDSKNNEKKIFTLVHCTAKDDFTLNATDLYFCLKEEKDDRKITFTFNRTLTNYWILENLTVPVVFETDQITSVRNTMNKVYAPIKFSYHCGNLTMTSVLEISGPNPEKVVLKYITKFILPDFQTEYFTYALNSTLLTFDSAYDCVGFTSGPIWSGIFVTFILALIMTFGLCMIMDIKTMDRFDDPKGKTISINVSE